MAHRRLFTIRLDPVGVRAHVLLEPAHVFELLVAEVADMATGRHRTGGLEHYQLEVVLLIRVQSLASLCRVVPGRRRRRIDLRFKYLLLVVTTDWQTQTD